MGALLRTANRKVLRSHQRGRYGCTASAVSPLWLISQVSHVMCTGVHLHSCTVVLMSSERGRPAGLGAHSRGAGGLTQNPRSIFGPGAVVVVSGVRGEYARHQHAWALNDHRAWHLINKDFLLLAHIG